jgi:nicotinamide phosphoribosyltransferase
MKATYVEVNGEARQIFKNPITDDGTKKSATGLLWVDQNTDGKYVLFDKVTWEGESRGFLQTIYKDGQLYNQTTLNEVREKLKA